MCAIEHNEPKPINFLRVPVHFRINNYLAGSIEFGSTFTTISDSFR
jgi:hypothetical protein